MRSVNNRTLRGQAKYSDYRTLDRKIIKSKYIEINRNATPG